MKINLKKPHLCHVCGSVGKFFHKKWWCTHDIHLKGICNNERKKTRNKD